MAFESLTDRLAGVFKKLRGHGKLSEADIKAAMREVRMALLEADVNYKVAKDFCAKVSERAMGQEVMESLTPAQQVVKIVNEELVALMGGEEAPRLVIKNKGQTIIMLCGLQGNGKTTHAAKLAKYYIKQGRRPMLVACDIYRPAAIDQLQVVGKQAGAPVFTLPGEKPPAIAKKALAHAKDYGNDIIILRADGSVGSDIRRKISTFCNVKPECVIENLTMPSLYQCPLMLHTGGLDDVVVKQLHLDVPPADLTEWKEMLARIATRSKTCTIALVGKYVKLHDAYLSVMESLYHAGFENDSQVEIKWVESEDLPDQAACREAFADVDGIIVPGGFGDRGIEGMIQAAQYARENDVPYFGICLGMQIMVMEFARHVLGYADANSSEFTPEGHHNVIDLMADQQGNIPKGGTMRLGKYPCAVLPGTKMAECYGQSEIWERHRHRYEFNNDYRQEMQDAGLVISGTSPDGRLVETVELPGRDFHLGAQFHPEFKSRPNRAHPLFKGFIAAALKFKKGKMGR